MSEHNLYEVTPSRKVDGANFSGGVQEFVFNVGAPNAWIPSKSYFRVGMTVYGAPVEGVPLPPDPAEMVALADNAVGNMFDNVYLRSNNVEISQISTGSAQASALNARIGNGYSWLKSIGARAELNEALFPKRVMYTSRTNRPDPSLVTENEMYRPTQDEKFDTQISINANGGSVAALVGTGKFLTGMPDPTTGAPTGGPVNTGDILVANGVPYPVLAVTGEDTLTVAYRDNGAALIGGTSDWYIVRKDTIRAPQANNTVYALWQPPIGIFNHDGALGSGEFRFQLNPNGNYLRAAIETRNKDYVPSVDGTTGTYSLVVTDVKFYAHIEKMKIPDSVQDLELMEYQVQSKPWSSNLAFTVSPYTKALAIFVQDRLANASPLIPSSMFKVLDNSDLKLQKIQVSYAGVTKPSTAWDSAFFGGADQLQQRYKDTYDEVSQESKIIGAETYHEWLQRGPVYYYVFDRDMSSRASEVMVNTTFSGLVNGPGTGIGGTGVANIFCVSCYVRKVQITTAAGALVRVTAA